VLAAPQQSCEAVTELLREFGVSGTWFAQPALPFHYQIKTNAKIGQQELPDLVSRLAKIGCSFECELQGSSPERYLFHPGIGIHRQQLDAAGEVLLRAEQVENELRRSAGNLKEFERRIRVISGVQIMDLLEPFRQSENVRMLPKAV
jgi:hypothetical protein